MPKFSDPNYYLLETYLDQLIRGDSGTQNSYLIGPREGIFTDGGFNITLYENHPTRGFVGHDFLILEINGNRFKMQYVGVASEFKKFRLDPLINPNDTETPLLSAVGQDYPDDTIPEMYFRKDSAFHIWLSKQEAFKNYTNQDRTFAFFGQLWPISGEEGVYGIDFEGLKDYAVRAIPAVNQTENMIEWLRAYFDHVQHEPYTLTKTLWSLFDAREIDEDFLGYIAQIYGIEINEEFTVNLNELPTREWE